MFNGLKALCYGFANGVKVNYYLTREWFPKNRIFADILGTIMILMNLLIAPITITVIMLKKNRKEKFQEIAEWAFEIVDKNEK